MTTEHLHGGDLFIVGTYRHGEGGYTVRPTVIREARIVAPIVPWPANNRRDDRSPGIVDLEHALCERFGGFTATPGHGAWRSEAEGGRIVRDVVVVYDVAMIDCPDSAVKLRAIALDYLRAAGQQCVYVRYADGTVQFVD